MGIGERISDKIFGKKEKVPKTAEEKAAKAEFIREIWGKLEREKNWLEKDAVEDKSGLSKEQLKKIDGVVREFRSGKLGGKVADAIRNILWEEQGNNLNSLRKQENEISSRLENIDKVGKMEWTNQAAKEGVLRERGTIKEEKEKILHRINGFVERMENTKASKEEIAAALGEGEKEKGSEK